MAQFNTITSSFDSSIEKEVVRLEDTLKVANSLTANGRNILSVERVKVNSNQKLAKTYNGACAIVAQVERLDGSGTIEQHKTGLYVVTVTPN